MPIKSDDQLDLQSLHRVREGWVGRRTAVINQHRGLLMERGIIHDDIQRDEKTAESNYLLYQSKREEERASNAMDSTRIANVAIAIPPAIPALPVLGWPVIGLIAIGVSLLISVGAAYTVDHFDPALYTADQVTAALNVPVVISMPKRVA